MTVDELIMRNAKLKQAYGHTDYFLVYWNHKGQSWIAKRDKTRLYRNIHEELFTAIYERNDIYDLPTGEIIEIYNKCSHKQNT